MTLPMLFDLILLYFCLIGAQAQDPYLLPNGQACETRTSFQASSFTISDLHREAAIFLYGHNPAENYTFITGLRILPGLHDLQAAASAALQANQAGIVNRCVIYYPQSDSFLGRRVLNQLQRLFRYNCSLFLYPQDNRYYPCPRTLVWKWTFEARYWPWFWVMPWVNYEPHGIDL